MFRNTIHFLAASACLIVAAAATPADTLHFDFAGTDTGVKYNGYYTQTQGAITVTAHATNSSVFSPDLNPDYKIYQIEKGIGVLGPGEGVDGDGRRINAGEFLWFDFEPTSQVDSINTEYSVKISLREDATFYDATGNIIPAGARIPDDVGAGHYTLNYTGHIIGVGFNSPDGVGIKVGGFDLTAGPLPLPSTATSGLGLLTTLAAFSHLNRRRRGLATSVAASSVA